MKKLISLIAAAAVVLSALCLSATALEVGVVGLEVVSAEGTKVVLDLFVDDAAEFFPKSVGAYVKYPSGAKIESCEFLRDDGTGTTGVDVPGIPYQITWKVSGDGTLSGKTAIARITFDAGKDVNETPFEVSCTIDAENPITDKDGKDVTGGFKFSGVTVGGRVPGDANGDGKVKLSDASVLLQYIAGWDVAPDMSSSDVNGDSKVNLNDVSLIIQHVAGWDVVLK